MNKFILGVTSFFIFTAVNAADTVTPLSIKDAAKKCEADVPNYCATKSCPQFCEKQYQNVRTGKDQKIADCKAQCKPDALCKLKPMAGAAGPETDLDKQNREQLIACIAQMRDPAGEKSGRRMEDWTTIQTPAWQKLMGAK